MQALAAEQLEGRYRPAVDQGRGLDRHLAAKRYRRQLACRKFRKTALGPGPRTSYKMPFLPPEGSKVRKATALGKLRGRSLAGGQAGPQTSLKNSSNYAEFCIDVVQ